MDFKIELGLTPNALTMQKSEVPNILLIDQSFQLNLSAMDALGIDIKDFNSKKISFIIIAPNHWSADDGELYLIESSNVLLPNSGKFQLTRKGRFSNMALFEQLYFPGNEVLEAKRVELKLKNGTIPALKILLHEG